MKEHSRGIRPVSLVDDANAAKGAPNSYEGFCVTPCCANVSKGIYVGAVSVLLDF
jgi:hypothetical protein